MLSLKDIMQALFLLLLGLFFFILFVRGILLSNLDSKSLDDLEQEEKEANEIHLKEVLKKEKKLEKKNQKKSMKKVKREKKK